MSSDLASQPTLTLSSGIALAISAFFAAAINSVAGGGTFLTFPTLIFCGFTEFRANTTSTVALWFGSVASVRAYWGRFSQQKRALSILLVTSFLGALLGSVLLLKTPNSVFRQLVPWLLLLATVTFIYGKHATRFLHRHIQLNIEKPQNWGPFLVGIIVQIIIAIYGGFFGGGIGIMMLALLTLLGYTDINMMNGMKTVLQTVINAVAVVTFIMAGAVNWPQASVMIVSAIIGGYSGARVAQRVSPQLVRTIVSYVSVSITIYFFIRTYVI